MCFLVFCLFVGARHSRYQPPSSRDGATPTAGPPYFDVRLSRLDCSHSSRSRPAVGRRTSIVPFLQIPVEFGSVDTLPLLLLANRPLWDMSVDCSAVVSAVLRTRPPVGEEGEQVGGIDVAVVVKVPGVSTLSFIRDPAAVLVGETAERNVADGWDRVAVTIVFGDCLILKLDCVERASAQLGIYGACPNPCPPDRGDPVRRE